jgi:hypothetical protein
MRMKMTDEQLQQLVYCNYLSSFIPYPSSLIQVYGR